MPSSMDFTTEPNAWAPAGNKLSATGYRIRRLSILASPAALKMVVQGFEAAGLQALHHGLQIGGIPQLDI